VNGAEPAGEIVEYAEAAVPIALRRQVLVLQDEAWPPGDGTPSRGLVHDPALDPWSVLLVRDAEVVAACDVLSSDLRHAGRSWRASGLSTVVTASGARRRGFGLRLVRSAIDVARARRRDRAVHVRP
jgi:GNAT superfamily N-acetyltransferase